jgi:ABC-type multidrug transport system fused ATPase/permease subunit
MSLNSQVFALDEATANVDLATDGVIQSGLKQSIANQAGATALIVAHRLDTIVDCNTVLVLSDGVSVCDTFVTPLVPVCH